MIQKLSCSFFHKKQRKLVDALYKLFLGIMFKQVQISTKIITFSKYSEYMIKLNNKAVIIKFIFICIYVQLYTKRFKGNCLLPQLDVNENKLC